MSDTRENIVTSLIGGRKTGKTDYLKSLIPITGKPKVLIVDTLDNPRWRDMETHHNPEGIHTKIPIIQPEHIKNWKSGVYRVFSYDTDMIKEIVAKELWNCLLIWEDATKYFNAQLTKKDKATLYDTKQRNVDSIYVFHSYRKANIEIVENGDLVTQKKTGDDLRTVKGKIGNPDIIKLWEHVMNQKSRFHTDTIWIV